MSNKSNKAERLQNSQYIVFVDHMDGDVHLGLDTMNGAVAQAFKNDAKHVVVECFPQETKSRKKRYKQ